jgi:hypothetical protein
VEFSYDWPFAGRDLVDHCFRLNNHLPCGTGIADCRRFRIEYESGLFMAVSADMSVLCWYLNKVQIISKECTVVWKLGGGRKIF